MEPRLALTSCFASLHPRHRVPSRSRQGPHQQGRGSAQTQGTAGILSAFFIKIKVCLTVPLKHRALGFDVRPVSVGQQQKRLGEL